MQTPLICGTFVEQEAIGAVQSGSRKANNLTFHRKLRMMRADVFALLSISMQNNFFRNVEDSDIVKSACLKFLEGEDNNKIKKMGVFRYLTGWNKLLYQKCNMNQVLNINSINMPKCVSDPLAPHEPDSSKYYVFAGFLQPGFHQFIIYDPRDEKAFCNEFIVDFNPNQVFYPEMPAYIPEV